VLHRIYRKNLSWQNPVCQLPYRGNQGSRLNHGPAFANSAVKNFPERAYVIADAPGTAKQAL
jgi:hypothetical protein